MYSTGGEGRDSYAHRVITVIEVRRLVVLGCTALFTMVWQLRIHDDRDEGW